MNKKHLALILIALVLLSLTAWDKYRDKIVQDQGIPFEKPKEQAANPKQLTPNTIATDTEEGEFYRIKVTYPVFPPVQAHVQKTIAEFKAEVENNEKIDLATITHNGEHKYELIVTTEEYHSGDKTSYLLEIYQDFLGAHGNTTYETHTYGPDGSELALTDIMNPESPYLSRLSEVAYAKVVEEYKNRGIESDERWIKDGTAAKNESFAAWYLDGENFVAAFPPYSVAAYAFGTFEARIPFSEIRDILK